MEERDEESLEQLLRTNESPLWSTYRYNVESRVDPKLYEDIQKEAVMPSDLDVLVPVPVAVPVAAMAYETPSSPTDQQSLEPQVAFMSAGSAGMLLPDDPPLPIEVPQSAYPEIESTSYP